MTSMIKRRTLLSALSIAFVGACARAKAGIQAPTNTGDLTGMTGQTLSDLIGGPGKVAWLSLSGTVRLTAGNANVRPATLQRAMMLSADGASARLFDVWQVTGEAAIAAPSATSGAGRAEIGPNDAGVESVWLSRSFGHGAHQLPIEHSRVAREGARVMAIDATQIWVLEGGVAAAVPALTGAALSAFEAWRAA
jgi:hypothetical protein